MKIQVDKIIEDLVPDYLASLRINIAKINKHLELQEWENIRVLGHNMKGSGGGYGLMDISEMGIEIQNGAKSEDEKAVRETIQKMKHYLDTLEIEYVDM